MLQTGEAVRTLRRSGSDLVGANSLQWAEGLITDADSSKQVRQGTAACYGLSLRMVYLVCIYVCMDMFV